jgi:hypothetical protein
MGVQAYAYKLKKLLLFLEDKGIVSNKHLHLAIPKVFANQVSIVTTISHEAEQNGSSLEYELHRFDPDLLRETGQVIRQVVSIKAKHGPRLRELPKVTVKLTADTGAEDQEVFRKHGAPGLREVQICRMAEEALD